MPEEVAEKEAKPVPGEAALREQLEAIRPAIVEEAKSNGDRVVGEVDPIPIMKQLVVDNYNRHRNTSKTPELTPDLVRISWFSGSRGNYRCIADAAILHGLRYEVSWNERHQKAYILIFKKINDVVVSVE